MLVAIYTASQENIALAACLISLLFFYYLPSYLLMLFAYGYAVVAPKLPFFFFTCVGADFLRNMENPKLFLLPFSQWYQFSCLAD